MLRGQQRIVGLSLHDFTAWDVLWGFVVVFGCLLGSYIAHYSIWRSTRNTAIRISSTLAIIVAWGLGWYYVQPRHPYWIHEFAVMAYNLSCWHLIDWIAYRLHEVIPPHVRLHHLVLDDALVMRPFLLRHQLGQRQATGRTWARRAVDAAPYLKGFALQYCGCEALNAWLMRQSVDDVLHGPLGYRLAATFVFGMTLYYHLGYFFNLLAWFSVLFMDMLPEDWPPAFNKPWAAASPTEFWNERWHSMFKWWFTRLVFKPTRSLMQRLLAPRSTTDVSVTIIASSKDVAAAAATNTSDITMRSLTPGGLTASTSAASFAADGAAAAVNASLFKSAAGLRRRQHGKVPSDGCDSIQTDTLIATGAQDIDSSSDQVMQDSVVLVSGLQQLHTDGMDSTNTTVASGKHLDDSEVVAGAWVRDSNHSSTSSTVSSSEADLCVEVQAMEGAPAAAAAAGAVEQAAGNPAAAAYPNTAGGPGLPAAAAAQPSENAPPPPPPAGVLPATQGVAGSGGGAAAATASIARGRQRPFDKLLMQAVPVMAVFLWSGVFHEILLKSFFGAATGEQLVFFVVHGLACLVHRVWVGDAKPQQQQGGAGSMPGSRRRQRKPMPRWMGVLLFNAFMVSSALQWFIRPWFRFAYHRELRVPVPGPVTWAVNWVLDALPFSLTSH